jgi:hypothetical protein
VRSAVVPSTENDGVSRGFDGVELIPSLGSSAEDINRDNRPERFGRVVPEAASKVSLARGAPVPFIAYSYILSCKRVRKNTLSRYEEKVKCAH